MWKPVDFPALYGATTLLWSTPAASHSLDGCSRAAASAVCHRKLPPGRDERMCRLVFSITRPPCQCGGMWASRTSVCTDRCPRDRSAGLEEASGRRLVPVSRKLHPRDPSVSPDLCVYLSVTDRFGLFRESCGMRSPNWLCVSSDLVACVRLRLTRILRVLSPPEPCSTTLVATCAP